MVFLLFTRKYNSYFLLVSLIFNNNLGDFRRKRNRALIPIFRRNRKDFHGNSIANSRHSFSPAGLVEMKNFKVFAH
jgi:hypothetical protein